MNYAEDLMKASMADQIVERVHGQEVEFVPSGRINEKIPYDGVIVSEANAAGTNESAGEGRSLERPDERSTRKTVILQVPARHEIELQTSQDTFAPDMFIAGGDIFRVQRIMSQDSMFLTILAVRTDVDNLRRASKKG